MLSFKEFLEEEKIEEAATAGIYKWTKYFEGKEVKTNLKKETTYYDKDLKRKGILPKGTVIVALKIKSYDKLPKVGNVTLYPIKTDELNNIYVSFESINKPKRGKESERPELVRDKELIPANFDLAGKVLTLKEIRSTTIKKLNSLAIEEEVKEFCRNLIDTAKELNFDIVSSLSDTDIRIILKDFGEITSAIHLLTNNPEFLSVTFPKANLPLVDFFITTNEGLELSYSVKSNKGSKPTITSLQNELEKLKDEGNLSSNHEQASDVIGILSQGSLFGGPLNAAKYLKTPGYKSLIELLSKYKLHSGSLTDDIPKKEDLQNFFTNMNDEKKKDLLNYFADANFKSSEKSILTIWGALHYPITSELIRWLNSSQSEARELITLAANALSVNQIYLDKVGKSSYRYIIKAFKESQFKFGTPSSIRYPLNNRIGFEMVK